MQGANKITDACEALRQGKFVIIHDFDYREDEVDMVTAAEFVQPEHIRIMRQDAGGLICQSIRYDLGNRLGLPYLMDVLNLASRRYPLLGKLANKPNPYGSRPAFSLSVNHKDTFTGITDTDRAKTISEVATMCASARRHENGIDEEFAKSFRAPGHVHLLLASNGLLKTRRGHTELSVYLVEMAGLTPTASICEMLDGKKYRALSVNEARMYSDRMGYPFLEGKTILRQFSTRGS